MKNSLSIGKKMFLISAIFVLGLLVLNGNAFITHMQVKKVSARMLIRNQHIDIVRLLQNSQLALMVYAMDSIVDKNEGKIHSDRMESIKRNLKQINIELDALERLADLEEEKRATLRIKANFENLEKAIQVDLADLIESRGSEEEFAKFDDSVDEIGEQIKKDLASIAVAVQNEQKEANEALAALIWRSSFIGSTAFFLTLSISLLLAYLIGRSIVNPIRNTIDGLNEGSEQVASASGQVSSASQSLAEGASEQAASLEETSSSLEEMSSMTKQNADNALLADKLMKESNHTIEKANVSMNELTSSMEEISRASEETQKIVKTIDEIAFQTNLLALNAAVEAARAGEAGAGFAVVADEVRNLAMRAAEAAKNTSNLIEGTVRQISEGSELVTKTNAAFMAVTASSTKVAELVAEIAAASNEQAHGIDQVNMAVADIDKVTQQNAANSEESASAAEQLNAQAEEMKRMVAHLVGVVEGTPKSNGAADVYQIAVKPGHMKELKPRERKRQPRQKATANQDVKPELLIPLDDDDFKDF